jgi:hypothetical protein
MRTPARSIFTFLFVFLFSALILAAHAQSNSGTVSGVVTDPSGAVVPGATVMIQNPVSQYSRTATTDKSGHFQFPNLPFNPYHLTVAMSGFGTFVQDVDVSSVVPINLTVPLNVSAASSTGEPIFFAQLIGDSGIAWSGCRLKWALPWARGSRIELLLHRRPAHHRSAEQGLFESASIELHTVA